MTAETSVSHVRTPLPSSGSGSFLKWVGGKTRYAYQLAAMVPQFSGTYREPFMGSAAVFFELQPGKAVLSDANPELVRAFRAVQSDPEFVMAHLDRAVNDKDAYLAVRSQDVSELSDKERGARLIYLNKTSFRGLWRVNKKGQMNVPWGAYDRPLYSHDMILACHRALKNVDLIEQDFEQALDDAVADDFVYLDPPYVPLGGFSDFKRYTPTQFHDDDHQRIADAMRRAANRGVHVLMTNSDTRTTRDIFKDFQLTTMATRRDVNLVGNSRASTDLLVSTYSLPTQDVGKLF